MTLDQLTEEVFRRLEQLPRAYLIGQPPEEPPSFIYVHEPPYEAVVLGILSPEELLHMPSDPVCEALLHGMPVYLWEGQPHRQAKYAKLLCRDLDDAEQRLIRLGVRIFGHSGNLIREEEAIRLKQLNRMPPAGSKLTPLAKAILEGTEI